MWTRWRRPALGRIQDDGRNLYGDFGVKRFLVRRALIIG